jgi:hypothetical protein
MPLRERGTRGHDDEHAEQDHDDHGGLPGESYDGPARA